MYVDHGRRERERGCHLWKPIVWRRAILWTQHVKTIALNGRATFSSSVACGFFNAHRRSDRREEKGREESDEMTQRGDDRKTLVFS